MRLWSIHPSYLDTKGLVALWREGLLAKHVLEGKTKGYKNHPQLFRFKQHPVPVAAIQQFLLVVLNEAVKRGYNFDASKIHTKRTSSRIKVTKGQVEYEWNHLLKKLKTRDPEKFKILQSKKNISVHPSFQVVNGDIEDWEVL